MASTQKQLDNIYNVKLDNALQSKQILDRYCFFVEGVGWGSAQYKGLLRFYGLV